MIVGFSGCTQKQDGGLSSRQEPVAQVNKYTITVDDFNHEVGFLRPVFRSISAIPPVELKLGILDEMINRELLLEEAQKNNIDKDPEFMRQIESFWRLSLIKQLLKHKMAEIESETTVTDDEINTEYAQEKSRMESPKSLKEVAPQLKEIILHRKVQKALQAWEDSLKTTAAIKRYYGVLNSIQVTTTGQATARAGQGGANGQRQ
jgi:hypothetical protein